MSTWLAMCLLCYMASCAGITVALQAYAIHRSKVPVAKETPKMFPILVMTPQPGASLPRAQVVYQNNLEEFLARYPDHTFLVPAEMESSLQSQLDQESGLARNDPGISPWSASFKIERLPNGHQLVELDAPPFDDTADVGWYEATDKGIIPRYHKTYNEAGLAIGAGFLAGPAALIPGLLLGTLATILRRRRARRRSPVEPPAALPA